MTTRTKWLPLLLATASFALPAFAGDDFTPPEGCNAILTVQSKACGSSLFWQCDISPEGDIWEASFGAEGLQSIVSYDRDYQWLDGTFMWDSSYEELAGESEDPISMDDLLAAGEDTFSFRVRRVEPSGVKYLQVVGSDRLTGKEIVIDGTRLLLTRTDYQYLNEDGTVDYQMRGQQYVSPERRMFFSGTNEVTENGNLTVYDYAPVEFITPGEPGFGVTTPKYECQQPSKK